MLERQIVAIDLGTSKIALTVAKISGDDIQIVYYKETPSQGIRYSRIINPKKASGPLKEAISDAENELGIKINQVIVGLPKYDVRQDTANMITERDPKECISEEEVDNIKSMAIDTYPLEDSEHLMLFGAVAQSFSDGTEFQMIEDDIIGMATDRLESNFKVFIGQSKYVQDIDIAFKNVGDISISRKYFAPDAMAKAVLYSSEMENGVALIDFGAGVTSVSIYYGNVMRHYAAIRFGGRSITADIQSECVISEKLAENIKLAYGACMPEKLLSLSEKTLQINSNDATPSKKISVKYLSEIISARAKEIIEAILYEIQKSGFSDMLKSGIVITGGGANLVNLGNYVKELSGYEVRRGYPKHIFSSEGSEDVYGTSAAASIGMILMAREERALNFTLQQRERSADSGIQIEIEDVPGDPSLDDNGNGNLFGTQEPENESVKEKEKAQKPKETKENKRRKLPIWENVGKLFTELYESME